MADFPTLCPPHRQCESYAGRGQSVEKSARSHIPNNVYEQGAQFIASADQLEQDAGFCLIFADVSQVVEDQQMILVQFVDSGLQRQFASREL